MRAGGLVGALGVAALVTGACANNVEVTQIGPRRPSRGGNCDIQIFLSAPPPYQVAEIASARAMCHELSGRTRCIEDLQRAACHAGADVVFGFSETMHGSYTYLSATFGVQDPLVTHRPIHDAPVKTQPAAASERDGGDCDPICSPGFACTAGQCVPQCNPPCESGEICSRKRVCEPARGKLAPAKAAGTSF